MTEQAEKQSNQQIQPTHEKQMLAWGAPHGSTEQEFIEICQALEEPDRTHMVSSVAYTNISKFVAQQQSQHKLTHLAMAKILKKELDLYIDLAQLCGESE